MDDKVLVVVLILLSCVVLSLGGVYASEDGSDTKNEFACCDMSDNAIYDNNLNSVCGGVDDSISQNTRVVDNLNDKNIVAENYGNNNGNGDVSKSMNTYGNLATDLDSISDYDFDIVTFTDLQGIINNANKGDTILLTQNYTYDSGFINTGISINKSLTIDGNGFTLDGAKSGRIFNINADGVVLKNLIMTNGNITDILILKKGGAISWIGSEGVIVNCTFINIWQIKVVLFT